LQRFKRTVTSCGKASRFEGTRASGNTRKGNLPVYMLCGPTTGLTHTGSQSRQNLSTLETIAMHMTMAQCRLVQQVAFDLVLFKPALKVPLDLAWRLLLGPEVNALLQVGSAVLSKLGTLGLNITAEMMQLMAQHDLRGCSRCKRLPLTQAPQLMG
jgi:hypothetical protein